MPQETTPQETTPQETLFQETWNAVDQYYSDLLVKPDSALDAAHGAHVVLHLTEWKEFRELDPAEVLAHVANPHVVDGRNALDADTWRAAGWTYRALGRP